MMMMRLQHPSMPVVALTTMVILMTSRAASGRVRIIDHDHDELFRADVGANITMTCISMSRRELVWYHDSRQLRHDHRYTITAQTPNSQSSLMTYGYSELHIANVRLNDSGVISCRTRSGHLHHDDVTLYVTEVSRESTVRIIEPKTSVLQLRAEQEILLKCTAPREHELEWRHNGTLLHSGRRLTITTAVVNRKRVSLITRRHTRARDAGLYECHSRSDAMNRDVVQVSMHGRQGLVRIVSPAASRVYVRSGTEVTLSCQSRNGEEVRWYRNDTLLSSDVPHHILDPQHVSSIKIFDVQQDAIYRCQSEHNTLDYDEVDVIINRTTSDNALSRNEMRVTKALRIHSRLTLPCEVDGHHSRAMTSHWNKDGVEIESSERFRIMRSVSASRLTIPRAERNDEGQYTCTFTDSTNDVIVGSIVYNVTAIQCPPPPASPLYTIQTCSSQYVGERCTVMCRHTHPEHPSALVSITCLYHDVTGIAHWSTPSQCQASDDITESVPQSLTHVQMQANERLRLHCASDVRAEWVRDGVVLRDSNKYHVQNGTLVIRHTGVLDVGVYTCRLYSHQGHVFGLKHYNLTALRCSPITLPHHVKVSGCRTEDMTSQQQVTGMLGDVCHFRCASGASYVSGSTRRQCVISPDQTSAHWTGDDIHCQVPSESLGRDHSDVMSSALPQAPAKYSVASLPLLLLLIYLSGDDVI